MLQVHLGIPDKKQGLLSQVLSRDVARKAALLYVHFGDVLAKNMAVMIFCCFLGERVGVGCRNSQIIMHASEQ